MQCGAVAEWSKALAWKVSIRQKRIVGSNPTRSATPPSHGGPFHPTNQGCVSVFSCDRVAGLIVSRASMAVGDQRHFF